MHVVLIKVRSADVIDINMILHTIFTMFVGLKTGCEMHSDGQWTIKYLGTLNFELKSELKNRRMLIYSNIFV